ncbi:MAG: two-component system sensor histidine kinase/response regulator [Candidatus Azotimanducaceae bacterium]
MLDEVADSIDAGIVLIDQSLCFESVNDWFCLHLGKVHDEIVGQSLEQLCELSTDARILDACGDAFEFGLPTKLSNRFNASPLPLFLPATNGEPRVKLQQRISIKPVSIGNSKTLCLIFIEDVSSTVAKEAILKRLAVENSIAREKAEEASHMKSEFLAMMSHEIRTPMNGVLGMLNLLKGTMLNERQKRFMHMAYDSASHLLTIINDVLDFSKIEAGKVDLDYTEFDLHVFLGQLAHTLGLRAREKNIELVLDLTGLPTGVVEADAGRLRQVLTNIIGNAIKFTEDGEVVIKVRLILGEGNNALLDCKIKDSGIGIASEKIERLFESFSQADASTTRKYGGTGLGLTIARQLSELMRGHVSVTSEVDVGSIFSVNIPVKVQQPKQSLTASAMVGRCALIVDDNSTNLSVLAGQLEYWGFYVISVAHAQAAMIELLAHKPDYFDVAVLDMRMPYVDGAELSRQIKAVEGCSRIPLILLSSMGFEDNADYLENSGFMAVLPKPISPIDLATALNQALNDRLNESGVPDTGPETRPNVSSLPAPSGKASEDTRHPIQQRLSLESRLLVVEDNTTNQLIISSLLKSLDYPHDIASNGLEALHALATQQRVDPYQLILMDCRMPEMDGYTATRAVRSGEFDVQQTQIPIIALTASMMDEDKEACRLAGMNDFLGKPVNVAQLTAMLQKWLVVD